MRWLVEITDITDKRFLGDLLSTLNIKLFLEKGKTYLTSDDFESLSTSSEVWARAEQIRDVISEISSGLLDISINFKLGTLYEQKEDGSRISHIFLSGAVSAGAATVVGVLTVIPAKKLLEEERARLEAERLEREYQDKFALVSSRVLPALRDERALKVHRFLRQDLTPVRLYHIYELIRDDLGEKLNSLASEKDWKRFTRLVNHQEVFGDNSRHMTLKAEPPSDPMTIDEAQAFISRAADLWFKLKSVDANDV